MTEMTDSYLLSIAGLQRKLPIVELPNSQRVAFLKLLGDTELLQAIGKEMATRLPSNADIILGPEAGGIVLAHVLSVSSGLPYVIARKKVRPYMKTPLVRKLTTSGTENEQMLVLGEDEVKQLSGRHVVVVDEVVNSGATLDALHQLSKDAGVSKITNLAVVTEGEPRDDVDALCHLPFFS
jgi:adenine phosphoribosyltransferase